MPHRETAPAEAQAVRDLAAAYEQMAEQIGRFLTRGEVINAVNK